MKLKKILFSSMVLICISGCFVDVMRHENEEALFGDGKQWRVYKFVLKDGREFTPMWEEAKSNMAFDISEDKIFGVSVCNNYFASFKLRGKKLQISDSGASRRLCFSEGSGVYEFNFVRGLQGEFVVKRKGRQMELKSKNITYYLEMM